jgi:glycosyltransferase involved in cell wall biosynthesis
LPRLYAGADAFLFASLSEGFGLPPLEAMACGAPVVASAVTSLPEVLGDAAVLVEPGESDAIFEGLRAVLGEKDLAEELRRRGRARARRFTWKECAKQTLQAWRKAIEPEKSPPQLRRTL